MPDQNRLLPGHRDEGLGSQVVDFIRLALFKDIDQRALVMQIALHDGDLVLNMAQPFKGHGAGTADHTQHSITFGQQHISQVGTILSGNARNQGGRHFRFLVLKFNR